MLRVLRQYGHADLKLHLEFSKCLDTIFAYTVWDFLPVKQNQIISWFYDILF